jgi:hypothetical protein
MVKESIIILLSFVSACLAENWEIGGGAGGGFYNSLTATSSAGQAAAGIARGPAFTVYLGQSLYPHFSGEIRYAYGSGDLTLDSGGAEARFRSVSHAFHYDVLVHPARARGRLRPFLAAGGGCKLFRGTGEESAYQPLSSFALLTQTQQWEPVVTAGGGVELLLSRHVKLRAELLDYMSPMPSKVITPAPGATLGGWLHQLTPFLVLGYGF